MSLNIEQERFYCKKCINHIGSIVVRIGKDGICNHCKHPDKYFSTSVSPEVREQKIDEMSKIMNEIKNEKGEREYDCIVAYSGGKDSTYLLYNLTIHHGLNVLAVTVNTGYMNEVAFQNIEQTINKLGVDHIVIEPPIEVFTKLYKWLILNYDSNVIPLMKPICDNCTDMIDGLVLKEAVKREIPYVFLGFSPDENARYFFEIPSEKINRLWIPEHWKLDFFANSERLWWWDPNKFNKEKLPRVILPLHVWPYNEKEIITTIEKEGLVGEGYGDPLKTNCLLIWGVGMFDVLRFGLHLYRFQIAKLVRQGAGNKAWLDVFYRLESQLAKGNFDNPDIERFFHQISMSKEEIKELALSKRQLDPRRMEIESVLTKKGISKT